MCAHEYQQESRAIAKEASKSMEEDKRKSQHHFKRGVPIIAAACPLRVLAALLGAVYSADPEDVCCDAVVIISITCQSQ
jgi:hypothetical protein